MIPPGHHATDLAAATSERFAVNDHDGARYGEVNGMPVLGIAGCNFFELFKSTVDFKADAVTLSKELFESE
jgi:hypothetical protein